MKFLSLFSGIGGFDLGLERAGMECVGQVEIDPFCNKVLEKHWPNVKRMGDIKNVKGDEFGTVELVCGGFPCQPFSQAGKRKGAEDDRFLWPEMFRVIQSCGPTWIIGENVSGIIGVELDNVLSQMEDIGYQVQTFIIPACAVDAKHRRDRVWIVGHSTSERSRKLSIQSRQSQKTNINTNGASKILAHTGCITERLEKCGRDEEGTCYKSSGCSEMVSNTIGERQQGSGKFINAMHTETIRSRKTIDVIDGGIHSEWPIEPELGRVAYGIPNRMDRLKSLGNAVVPQIVEIIGRAIMQIENIKNNN
jgi:DNA (cytosine-5)-methyltransferase 1